MPLLAPAAGVLLVSVMPPEVVFTLGELALLGAAAYAAWRLLLAVVDALTGWPPEPR